MALTHAALTGAENEVPTLGSLFRGDPIVRVGRRFLPVAAAALPPMIDRDGLVALPLAPGTPVHAVAAGRVVSAEGATAGEIVIRIESEVRIVYRKLLPSSVTVAAGDVVTAGDVIGTVAPSSGDRLVTLELGVQNPDGSWEKLSAWLTGLPDPLELYTRPPSAQRRAAKRSQPSQAAKESKGFTVVKTHPDEPEPQPEPEPPEVAKPAPLPSPRQEPEPPAPEPAGGRQPPGAPDGGRDAHHPEPAAEPVETATGASALTSRRRRGRPARSAPNPPQPEPAPDMATEPAAEPAPNPAPEPEPAPSQARHMRPAPEPEPAAHPEPAPEPGIPEAQHMRTVREPEPSEAKPVAEMTTPAATTGPAEPAEPEPEPETTLAVPDVTQAEPAETRPESDRSSEASDHGDSDANRASKASRLTSRRQRPKRSRP